MGLAYMLKFGLTAAAADSAASAGGACIFGAHSDAPIVNSNKIVNPIHKERLFLCMISSFGINFFQAALDQILLQWNGVM
jgi:hypothetical protein